MMESCQTTNGPESDNETDAGLWVGIFRRIELRYAICKARNFTHFSRYLNLWSMICICTLVELNIIVL